MSGENNQTPQRSNPLDKQVKVLPWQCKKHPNAKILHTFTKQQYLRNGYRIGEPDILNNKYECIECGSELQSP